MFQTGINRGEMGEFKWVVMKNAEGNVGYLKGKVAITTDNDSHNGGDGKREGSGRARIQSKEREHIGT